MLKVGKSYVTKSGHYFTIVYEVDTTTDAYRFVGVSSRGIATLFTEEGVPLCEPRSLIENIYIEIKS